MLIDCSTHTGNAEAGVKYFLSAIDSKGNKRSVKPEILRGNPENTINISRDLCADRDLKTSSGVISFAHNEKPSREELEKLLDDLEKTFFGNMRNRVNALFVAHADTKNFHIHFMINRIDLKTGKAYNPFPPGQMTLDLMEHFTRLKNEELGYEQVVKKSTTKLELTDSERKARRGHFSLDILKDKISLDKSIQKLVKDGAVKDRNELIDFLKNEGLKLSRIGEDYISIEREGRNIRLRGGIYAKNEDKPYEVVKQEFIASKVSNAFDMNKSVAIVNRIVKARDDYNTKRYDAKPASKPVSKTLTNGTTPPAYQKPAQQARTVSPIPAQQKQPSEAPGAIARSEPAKTQDQQGFTADSPRSGTTGNSLNGLLSAQAGVSSAQTSLDRLLTQLSQAKTYAERLRLEYEIAQARQALNNAFASLEEEKKKQLGDTDKWKKK
ncbi:relaxase/mobilization nuclease domain-containing protein [Burkholderia sp. BCC0097]|uniref:relaxase/mobilization nuclease domain-containing protein n=1 Tax=Burkholderia sp. BCC0097 TaxID=2676289 RepID=UPI00158E3BA4|nr:relaxase/mobilization nuclease domain-containing protein [Burkholderia sp. BCC0097]